MTQASDGILRVDDKELTLRRVAGTVGEDGLNISSLLKDSGMVTLNAGFEHRLLHERDHLHRR